MRPFKRKPKPPLAKAIRMVSDATEVAYKYLRDCTAYATKRRSASKLRINESVNPRI